MRDAVFHHRTPDHSAKDSCEMAKPYPTTKYLRECLNYNPDTGIFIWKSRPLTHFATKPAWQTWNTMSAGIQAATLQAPAGYMRINLNYERYRAHRLAFIWMGEALPEQVDHIDHDRINNKWTNLRPASYATNGKNQKMPLHNTSGFVGVHWSSAASKWAAEIIVDGKKTHLGVFTKKADAIASRKAANVCFGFHPNHGKRDIY